MSESNYNILRGGKQVGAVCPKCNYRLSNFRTSARCFNCDYAERGSDGPWVSEATAQSLIWDAERVWDGAVPLSEDEYKYHEVYKYLKQRCVFDLASTCDQLRTCNDQRYLKMRSSGSVLVARVWHVRKGFIGIHATRCEWVGGDQPYQRDERRTLGACQGGGVWFGSVTPENALVVAEGIETVLSAMILWGAKAGVATLGTEGLMSLVLPSAARRVVIAADNDPLMPDKKYGVGLRDARIVKRLWLEEDPNIEVEIKMAPGPAPRDWNDVLCADGEQCHV